MRSVAAIGRYHYAHTTSATSAGGSVSDEKQEFLNCCKIGLIALLGYIAIKVALVPFQQGVFTPTNPVLGDNITSSFQQQQQPSNNPIDTSGQRLILVSGIHPTLAQNLLLWTHSANNALQAYAYPIPQEEELSKLHFTMPPRYRAFDPLLSVLVGEDEYYQGPVMKGNDRKTVMKLYSDKIGAAWKKKKSVMMVSEEVGRLVRLKGDKGVDRLFNDVLQPAGITKPDQVQVVVVYNHPRHKTLLELWNMWHPNSTLTEFIRHDLDEAFVYMHPLGVAETFAKKGARVVLMDASGMQTRGKRHSPQDMSTAFACLLLDIPCDRVHGMSGLAGLDQHMAEIPKDIQASPEIAASKLKEIEKLFQDFDCQYLDSISHLSNIHIVYRDQLFKSCSSATKKYSSKDLIRGIQALV